jgi:hypothetical protein
MATTAAIARLMRTPGRNPSRWSRRAPKTAMASAPPSWRLVLNTPLTVPASESGTLFNSTEVIGGMMNGPGEPYGQHECSDRHRCGGGETETVERDIATR